MHSTPVVDTSGVYQTATSCITLSQFVPLLYLDPNHHLPLLCTGPHCRQDGMTPLLLAMCWRRWCWTDDCICSDGVISSAVQCNDYAINYKWGQIYVKRRKYFLL